MTTVFFLYKLPEEKKKKKKDKDIYKHKISFF